MNVEVAAGNGERGRVEPEPSGSPSRSGSLRASRRSTASSSSFVGSACRLPSRRRASRGRAASARVRTTCGASASGRAPPRCRRAAVQLHLAAARSAQVGKWTCESVKPGDDAAAAEVHDLRARERSLVDADAARDAVARRSRARRRSGSDGSSVRTMPFSRITDADSSPYRTLPLSLHGLDADPICFRRQTAKGGRMRRQLGIASLLTASALAWVDRCRRCGRCFGADRGHGRGGRLRADLRDGRRHREPRRAGDDLVRRVRQDDGLRLEDRVDERRVGHARTSTCRPPSPTSRRARRTTTASSRPMQPARRRARTGPSRRRRRRAPDAVTGSATGLSSTSATLTGTVNPNGRAATWYFEYGTSTSYGTKTPAQNAGCRDDRDGRVRAGHRARDGPRLPLPARRRERRRHGQGRRPHVLARGCAGRDDEAGELGLVVVREAQRQGRPERARDELALRVRHERGVRVVDLGAERGLRHEREERLDLAGRSDAPARRTTSAWSRRTPPGRPSAATRRSSPSRRRPPRPVPRRASARRRPR